MGGMAARENEQQEVADELLRISASKTFKRKTVLKSILKKYLAVYRDGRESDFASGIEFMKIENAVDLPNLKKRRIALSDSLKKYYKKEGKKSGMVLSLNDDDLNDVRLYRRDNKRLRDAPENEKPFLPVNSNSTIVYVEDERKRFRNEIVFHAMFMTSLALMWIVGFFSIAGAIKARKPFPSAFLLALGVTLVAQSLRLSQLLCTKFVYLSGKLFLKMIGPEVIVASYSGKCLACGHAVQVENDKCLRNIGKCQLNPVKHRFTFDHATLKGELIE